MSTYNIQSRETSRYIISTVCDVSTQVVLTIDGSAGLPPNTKLTLTPGINPSSPSTNNTIAGSAGLFIGLNEDNSLVWSQDAYTWQVVTTPDSDVYEIIPFGSDLYCFTSAAIQPLVTVKSGGQVLHYENQWFINAVEA